VLFLVFGDYTRRTRVSAQLVPDLGVATVTAPATGILAKVPVREGQRVLAGEVLAVLAVPRATLAGGDTAQALQSAIALRQAGLAGGFDSQRAQWQAQQAGLAAQIDNAQAELRARQFVTELQLQQQQAAELEQLGAVQALQAGQPLLSLLPAASQLEAHLLVPSRAVGFVEPGDSVRLRYQAIPYQRFGHHQGQVQRISRSALAPSELVALLGSAPPGEPFYRIVVALDRQTVRAFGQDEALKPGMRLEADILGERRALWEWALEPLYALHGRMESP